MFTAFRESPLIEKAVPRPAGLTERVEFLEDFDIALVKHRFYGFCNPYNAKCILLGPPGLAELIDFTLKVE